MQADVDRPEPADARSVRPTCCSPMPGRRTAAGDAGPGAARASAGMAPDSLIAAHAAALPCAIAPRVMQGLCPPFGLARFCALPNLTPRRERAGMDQTAPAVGAAAEAAPLLATEGLTKRFGALDRLRPHQPRYPPRRGPRAARRERRRQIDAGEDALRRAGAGRGPHPLGGPAGRDRAARRRRAASASAWCSSIFRCSRR